MFNPLNIFYYDDKKKICYYTKYFVEKNFDFKNDSKYEKSGWCTFINKYVIRLRKSITNTVPNALFNKYLLVELNESKFLDFLKLICFVIKLHPSRL